MIMPMSRAIKIAAVAVTFGATMASAQDNDSVLDRLFGRPGGPAAQDAGGPSGQPTTEQILRIERLEAQIRQMTGTIEQLQYRNQQLEAHIRQLEGGTASAPSPPASRLPAPSGPAIAAPAGGGAAQVAVPPTGRRSDVFDPAHNPNAPGAPRPLGTIPAEPPAVVMADPHATAQVGAPGGRGTGAPLDLSTLAAGIPRTVTNSSEPPTSGPLPPPPSRSLSGTGMVVAVAPPTESAKDYYDLAYGYVLRKDYALAEQTFESFLKKFPNDRRGPDAQFWLGESLFQRQRYDQAASAFLDMSTKHSEHAKAAEALLRLGQSLAALKQKEMACATFAEVGRKYPRASNVVKHGVEREQKRVRC
jgi:tol-pal system protein YbgF